MRITRRELFAIAGAGAAIRVVGAQADQDLAATVERARDVIREYNAEGFHRTATSVDRASADRLLVRMRGAVSSPRLEPFELSRVDPNSAFFEVDRHRIEGLPMFDGAFTDPEGIRGALGGIESDRPIAWVKVNPNAEVQLRKARERSGLRALIAVTTGQRPGLCPVNAAFFSDPFGPPVLQVSSEELPAIEKAAESGADVRIVAAVTRRPATAFDLVADVLGRQRDLPAVCVMTPRSGWYFNASERGGGLMCWLETLRACAAARPVRTVRFVASSGHELGHLGLHGYLKRNPTLARAASVWIHFGANIGAATGEVRVTCSADSLESEAIRALTPYDLNRLAPQPASQVGGEAATIRAEGGRFVSFIGSNEWFHNAGDRWPDAVDLQKVARFARAAANLTITLANVKNDSI
jgi:hypothetical protein